MLLKDLKNGDQCIFLPRNARINTIYIIRDGCLYWYYNNDIWSQEQNVSIHSYLNREVEKVNPTFDIITAFQKMKEGKKVRLATWPKGRFVYAVNGKIFNKEDEPCTLTALEDLNEKWEDFQEPKVVEVKLNSEYTAKVSSEDIVVGCQSFPHSKVEELAKAIKEVTG